MIQLPVFMMPTDMKQRLEVEDAEAYWIYWTPSGDEMVRGKLTHYGTYTSDVDWRLWFELEKLNQAVFWSREWNLGSSDAYNTHVLFFKDDKTFIASTKEVDETVKDWMNKLQL